MPGPVSLASLVTRVRRRADMESTDFVSDPEIEDYIENSMGELIDVLIEEGGGDWMSVTTPTSQNLTVAGTDTYTIWTSVGDQTLAKVYKILGVEVSFDGKWRRITGFSHWQNSAREDFTGWNDQRSVSYRVIWQPTLGAEAQIQFEPTPQAAHEFRVLYIPYPGDWSTAEFANFHGFTGWDEYIVVDAAMKCLEKEESTTAHLQLRKQQLYERIRHHAKTMNYGDGFTLRDAESEDLYPDDFLPWILP